MNDWQPIETAPKDGTEILVCGGHIQQDNRGDWGANTFMVVAWGGQHWDMFDSDGVVYIESPTHWMHLPELPK